MLTIRNDQLGTLWRSQIAPLRLKMIAELRSALPEESGGYTEGQLTQVCEAGIQRAGGYGIRVERNVYRFVAAMLVFGLEFDAVHGETWSPEILHSGIDEDFKAELLALRILAQTGKTV